MGLARSVRAAGARPSAATSRSSRSATRGLNQDDKVVISYERTILVPKRGHGVEDLKE